MPYKIKKIRNKNVYQVVNIDTGAIKAKHTTKEKAEAMIRLLHYIDHKKK